MAYYPIFLELEGRRCLVVGGGAVSQRKVEGLLGAGARVTVVSPRLCDGLENLRRQGRVEHLAREYAPGDLAGFALAVVATDDGSVNGAVADEGRERAVWVNAVDDPANCDFIVPSVTRRGDLTVAISTGATSPALARKVREEMEEFLDDGYGMILSLAAEVRRVLEEKEMRAPAQVWNAALDEETRRLLVEGRREEAKERLLRALVSAAKARSS